MKKIILSAALSCGLLASATTITPTNSFTNLEEVTTVAIEVNPFCKSISKNDMETVKKLINMGENVNKFSGGMSPLMYAARYNRVEMIKLLVENGAKIKARDAKGNNAIEHAKRSGAKEAEALLRELNKSKKKRK